MTTKTGSTERRVLTWRGTRAPRMESVRVQFPGGRRLKATGRILGAEHDHHPAFSSTYTVEVDDAGRTSRFELETQTAEGDRHLLLRRDAEGMWRVDVDGVPSRVEFAGAVDVDCQLSPFFNALAIRRLGLHERTGDPAGESLEEFPVVYVDIPAMSFRDRAMGYRRTADGIFIQSPVYEATARIDSDGFVRDYPGLAERI